MESTGEQRRFGAPKFLEITASNSWDEDEDESKIKPKSSPTPRRRSSSSSDDSEAEGPPVLTRKVSFADAFGLNLVRVKEFDSWDVPTTSFTDTFEDEVPGREEYFLSSVFVVPSSHDELMQKLYEQKVELESFEFVPGGLTAMKGIIRVFNVCFEKLVYVRMTLDAWNSYYDLMAQYVPGSSDGETDQFSFKISLVPPYQKDGGKVEFCIRYETSVGTFWANNNGLNYVLFCHKKEIPEVTKKAQEENTDKNIKSCLKTINSKGNATALDDTLVQPGTPDLSKNKTQVVASETIENQEAPHGDTTQLEGDYKEQLQPQMDQKHPTPMNQSNMGTNSSVAENHNSQIHDHSFKKTKVCQIHSEEQPDIKEGTKATDHKVGIPQIWEKRSIPSPTCDENQTSTRDNRNPESLETFSQTFQVQSWQCSQEAESMPEDVLPSKEDKNYVYREDALLELEQEKNILLGDKVFRRTTEDEVLEELLFIAEEEEDANILKGTSEMELPAIATHYRKFNLDHTSEKNSSPEAKDPFKSKSDLSKDNVTSYEYNVKDDIVMDASNEHVWKDIGISFHDVNNRDQKSSSATSQEVIKKEIRLDSENTSNSFLEDGNLLGSDNLACCSKDKESKETIQENVKKEWSYDVKVSESGLDKKHLIPRIMVVATDGAQVDKLSNKHECESISANKAHEKSSTEPPQEKETVCQEDIIKASQQGYTQTEPLQDIMQQTNVGKESILDLYNDENNLLDTEPERSTSKYEAVQYITSIQETYIGGEVRPTKTYVENTNEVFIFSKHNAGTQEESNYFYTAIKPESSLSGQIVNVPSDDTSTLIEEDIYTGIHYSIPGNKKECSQIAITNEPSEEMSVQQVSEKKITTETADVKMNDTTKNTTRTRRGRQNTITPFVNKRQHEGHQQKLLNPVILISEAVDEEDETEVETEALKDHQELLEDTEETSSESWSTVENAEIIDSTGLSLWNSETLILHHISKVVLYFLLFVAFLVTVYHYDFVGCFVLYIFSVCWLYCQGGKHSESFSKK